MYVEARPSLTRRPSVVSTASRGATRVALVVMLCTLLGGGTTEVRSQVKRDYPLNLSILLRGGKEHNYDALSNGE